MITSKFKTYAKRNKIESVVFLDDGSLSPEFLSDIVERLPDMY